MSPSMHLILDVAMREVRHHTERMRREREANTAKRNSHLLADAARKAVDEHVDFQPVMRPMGWRGTYPVGTPGPDGTVLVHPDEYRRFERSLEGRTR